MLSLSVMLVVAEVVTGVLEVECWLVCQRGLGGSADDQPHDEPARFRGD